MMRVSVRAYAELNEFLSPERRFCSFELSTFGRPTVKDLVEGVGIPHTEVDLVLVNGRSVAFDQRLQEGDRVAVYPVFESLDIGPLTKVRPQPLRKVRFAADVHLGRLAAYLRMMGFDTWYANRADDEELASLSAGGRRILLTRDRGLLMRRVVTHGYWLRATAPRQQLVEVLKRFDLRRRVKPFSRCLACNGLLERVAPTLAANCLPSRIKGEHDRFHRCRRCGRIYWRGGHYKRMLRLTRWALRQSARGLPHGAADLQGRAQP